MKSVACSPRGVARRSCRTRRAPCSTTSPPEQGGLESVCMESRRPRVLVVDDERHIVDLVAMGLEGRGLGGRGAREGAAALEELVGSRRPRVRVVDGEPHIVDLGAMGLEGRGMEVRGALDGAAALKDLEEFRPDVMVLDLMLPGLSGMEVCRRARAKSNVPILILSARDAVQDRVGGLNLGADDYVVKPFAFEELAARVVALLRRSGAPPGETLRYSDLELDGATREVRRNDHPIDLTGREFALLRFFMEHPRQVFSKHQLLAAVGGLQPLGA